jgi:hypothetical protein
MMRAAPMVTGPASGGAKVRTVPVVPHRDAASAGEPGNARGAGNARNAGNAETGKRARGTLLKLESEGRDPCSGAKPYRKCADQTGVLGTRPVRRKEKRPPRVRRRAAA